MIENIQKIYNLIIENKWLLFASLFSALTVIMIKYYLLYKNTNILILTFVNDIALIYSYVMLLQHCDILTSFVLVKILSILIVLFQSVFFLDTKLTRDKIIGLIFSFIAIYFMR
jgi:hypothetical protein